MCEEVDVFLAGWWYTDLEFHDSKCRIDSRGSYGGIRSASTYVNYIHAQAKSHTQISSITGTGCDGVIGIGGSQVLDASKLISLIGTNRTSFTSLDEFAEEHAESMRSAQMGSGQSLASLTKDPATLFTVPTGGATGCEVTPRALVYEGENFDPLSFSDMGVSTRLVPSACIVDPDLFDVGQSKLDGRLHNHQSYHYHLTLTHKTNRHGRNGSVS